jgi:NAD(P)-dependent dehydrogenase (short-subunit alcohol dehydrogenase family)
MPTVFITGANKGLGLEFARQYADDGWRVIASCPDPAEARELKTLKGQVDMRALDVRDGRAIEELAQQLEGTAIDLLLLNAGLHLQKDCTLDSLDGELWLDEMRVNVVAPIMVARRFAGLVARSGQRRIVAMSSSLGSIAMIKNGGNYAYRAGKAALNSSLKILSADLAGQGITVVAIAPGLTRTDMGGPNALFSTEDSVSNVRRTMAALGPGDSGKFLSRDATPLPW